MTDEDPKKMVYTRGENAFSRVTPNLNRITYETLDSPSANIAAGGSSFVVPRAVKYFLKEADEEARRRAAELHEEIRQLRETVDSHAKEASAARADAASKAKALGDMQAALETLQKKEQFAFLLARVSEEARGALLARGDLRAKFFDDEPKALFAMSVDIRRSTDLMLKARDPKAFAAFITDLCDRLMGIVQTHRGVVDKFTGDGILCFFPEFFSGPDAGYLAIAAADACHAAFSSHYRASRHLFQSVLSDIGLGIGIDYGNCQLVQVAGSLTIVGPPVVYACRLGGAPAGRTLLNQAAYEEICSVHGARVLSAETTIDIKHEGNLVAYTAKLNPHAYEPKLPDWLATAPAVSSPGAAK